MVCPFCGGQRNILAFGKSIVAPSSFRTFFTTLGGRSSREPPIIRASLQHHVHNTKRTYRFGMSFLWWAEVDSNHRSRRRQIYSLIHLAALESAHIKLVCCGAGDWTRTHNLLITNQLLCQLSYTGVYVWCLGAESNHRQADFQSAALPTELPRHFGDPKRARTVDLQRDRLAL